MSSQISGQIARLKVLITTGTAVAGFGPIAFGLFKLIMHRPGGQDSVGGSIGMILGGSALLVVTTVANIGSETLLQGDANKGLDALDGFNN